MNRNERRAEKARAKIAPRKFLAAGQKAWDQVPDELKPVVESHADMAIGRPWIVAAWATENFQEMSSEIRGAEPFFRVLVAAMLERMGADLQTCAEPHQAMVYINSAYREAVESAERYTESQGGPEAVARLLQKWRVENKALRDALPCPLGVKGGKLDDRQPCENLDALLTKWIGRAREQFDADGSVAPICVGVSDDGLGRFISPTHQFRNLDERRAFIESAQSFLAGGVFVMSIYISEAWATESAAPSVRPSQAENRKEIIFFLGSDGTEARTAMVPIERDWQTGEGSLGPTEGPEVTEATDSLRGATPML